jgi:hypothetical protein
MPKAAHTDAAEHHERAAKSHRDAADHHDKGDKASGSKHADEAVGHSTKARAASRSVQEQELTRLSDHKRPDLTSSERSAWR